MGHPDDTLRLAPPRHAVPWRRGLAGLLLCAALLAGGGWAWWRSAPGGALPETEPAELLRLAPRQPQLLRLAGWPQILVLVLPDTAVQAAMLNRAAALLEKAGAPKDAVLGDVALAHAIAADGDTAESYYSGHNYMLADLDRFFRLAAAAGIRLTAEEAWLRKRLALARREGGAALISFAARGEGQDAESLAAILLHEIGHGIFFSQPAFASHVLAAWRSAFTPQERAALTAFLAQRNYDTRQEGLMANEAMAYLLFTPDRRFFDPARDAGLDAAAVARLRQALWHPMLSSAPCVPAGEACLSAAPH